LVVALLQQFFFCIFTAEWTRAQDDSVISLCP
jgi:hypothetical protein